jgi:uncharacterized protein YndB with AHSA1/START domain
MTTTQTAGGITLVAEPGSALITTERVINGPRDLVFRCYQDPELVKQWMGPRRLTCTMERWDFRHGGAWAFTQTDTDGSEYAFRGTFHGDPTPEQLVQTFEFLGYPGHVSLDTLHLVDLGDGRTLIRTMSAFQSVEDRDGMLASGMTTGMDEGYERLEALVAGLAA